MNVSYLTDTEVRREYLMLLQAIDEKINTETAPWNPISVAQKAFWESLGYSESEIPQY
jgi:hypothetical protein